MKSNIFDDIHLNFEKKDNKYYLILLGKNIKTKQGYDICFDDLLVIKKVCEDFKKNKFKSKWLNLLSNYIDFKKSEEKKNLVKDQAISYLYNDLLLFIEDESNEYFVFQEETYLPLLAKFSSFLDINQRLIPTTGLEKVYIDQRTLVKLSSHLDTLNLKELFVLSFFVKISTSIILSLFLINKDITSEEFFEIAFHSELDKQSKTLDKPEQERLNSIKNDIEILSKFINIK